jgi:hypothetical protein
MPLPPPPPGFVLDSQQLGRPVIRSNPQPSPQTGPQRQKDEIAVRRDQLNLGVDSATSGDRIRKARAERIAAERAANQPNPEDAKIRAGNKGQRADLKMIAQQLNRVQQLYNKDLKGVGIGSVAEYLPTPKMQRFEAQAKALAVLLKPLIRNPGEGTWTDADQKLLDRLVPTRFTSDTDNVERIETAKRFLMGKFAKHGGGARRVPVQEEEAKPEALPDGWSIEEED